MNLLILFFTLFAFFSSEGIDYSKLEEQSVGVQINGSDKLQLIPGEKCSFNAGEGILGYSSKLSVKGLETQTEIKKGADLVFYARKSSKVKSFTFSIVQMEEVKGKRVAQSKEGITYEKDKKLTTIPCKAIEVDKTKGIYKITPNESIPTGTWCANFRRVIAGEFPLNSGYGKKAFCFKIVE